MPRILSVVDLRLLLARNAMSVRKAMLQSRKYGKKEADERGLTDELVARLVRTGRGAVTASHVSKNEDFHGADIELWLRGEGYLLGFRLQAKCLKPSRGNQRSGIYENLHHRVRKSQNYQVDLLIANTPAPMVPAYLFYNALTAHPGIGSNCCSDEWRKELGLLGLTIAPAEAVRRLKDATPRRKTLSEVLPESIPIPCLAYCNQEHYWYAEYPSLSLPLSAARSLDFLGLPPVTLVRDPFRAAERVDARIVERAGFEVADSSALPPYIRVLLSGERIPDEADLPARYLMVWDDDSSQ